VLLDLLAHLDLLRVPLLGVQLGPQAAQVLRILALLVALARRLLARALLVVEAPAVELAVPFCFAGGWLDCWKLGRHHHGRECCMG
jgi:hypothetical protein